ncbi:MAG TPA: helix-turn-helix transcriptional regulator, partial [Clostridia bacterium]|nr:helix-turn-helix transcriptional regulator [Clostridia bacterium]
PIEWRPSMILAMMLRWSGDIAGACARFEDLHRQAIDAGDETSLPFLLAQLSEAESAAGEWAAALDHAEAAHTLALQTGQEPMRAEALHARALAQAYLGRVDDARASARAGLELSQAAGSVVFMLLNQSVLGFVELSVDEPGAAHEVLGPLVNWAEVIGIRDPGILRFVPDEVEALIALGSLDKAAALLEPYAADAARLGYPDAQLAAARARALHCAATGDLRTAARLVSDALERCGRDGPPFELARARLALGSIQRRTRRRAEARASLEAADDAFRKLGARLWAAKAERLLGENGDDRPAGATASLTPAERRVADLVAGGATNRSAADRLFVSVRAVEVHLTNIYRKLGIRSRTELAALMTREERTPDAGGTP